MSRRLRRRGRRAPRRTIITARLADPSRADIYPIILARSRRNSLEMRKLRRGSRASPSLGAPYAYFITIDLINVTPPRELKGARPDAFRVHLLCARVAERGAIS